MGWSVQVVCEGGVVTGESETAGDGEGGLEADERD